MKLIKSFYYAFCGLWYCIKNERNFRIHIAALVTVMLFSYFYRLPGDDYPVIILTIAAVMAMEAVNTAVEKTVDTATEEKKESAKTAKDAAAAGVLIMSIGAVGVAIATYSDLQKLFDVLKLFSNPMYIVGLIIYILIFAYFVFGKERKRK